MIDAKVSVFEQVVERSGGKCEAMIRVHLVWTRCGRMPIQIHHRLTRARGGLLLDQVGETYHLMALCPGHHGMAHDAKTNGLLLEGYVLEGPDGPSYVGPDKVLAVRYP